MQRGVEVFPKDKAGKSWLATRRQCTCSSVYESLNFCEEENNFWYCISHYGEKKKKKKKKRALQVLPCWNDLLYKVKTYFISICETQSTARKCLLYHIHLEN